MLPDQTALIVNEAFVSETIKDYKDEVTALKAECARLQEALDQCKFSAKLIESDDAKTRFYTGFPTYVHFTLFLGLVQEKAAELKTWKGASTKEPKDNMPGVRPWRNLHIADQLFAVLVRLRLGLTGADVATRLCIPESTFCRMFTTWILFLSKELSLLFPWPSREKIDSWMPKSFRSRYIL